MRNCIILGSGRSGTSMVAGTLAKSGYFMGDNLLPPRQSNPKGFFEDPFINGINEQILSNVRFKLNDRIKRLISGRKFSDGQRWLEIMPIGTQLYPSKSIENKISIAVDKSPFCYKDPRFSFTLPFWRPFLENTVFICVFREPSITALSIVKECKDMEYLHSLTMSYKYALEVWHSIYTNILESHMSQGEWLFIHYDQIVSTEGLDRIETLTNAKTDRSFPDIKLKRTSSSESVDNKYRYVYEKLCLLSGF